MSEALKRARKEAFVNRERAAGFLAQTVACAAEGYSDEDAVSFAVKNLEEDQAVLDAIDAAIAADDALLAGLRPKRPTIEIGYPIGDGQEVKFRATVEDLKELLGGFATGGIAGADVEPGVVGEQPGGLADAPLKREWSMFMSSGDGDARPIQLGDIVEARTKFRVVGISERSTDGLNLGVSEEDGPFCQLEVQACGTTKTLELLASDLRRL